MAVSQVRFLATNLFQSTRVWKIGGKGNNSMQDFNPATSFGPAVAARYDDNLRGDEQAAVAFLSELARGRRA
jgi:hypothetical protein